MSELRTQYVFAATGRPLTSGCLDELRFNEAAVGLSYEGRLATVEGGDPENTARVAAQYRCVVTDHYPVRILNKR